MIVFEEARAHPFTPVKIAFLTGLSNPNCCQLSPIQKTFLRRLECPEAWKIYLNFPYLDKPNNTQQSSNPNLGVETNIITNSLFNIKQYFQASSQIYKTAATQHLSQLAASTNHLILLVGSCGLEILNHALTPNINKKLLHLFVYGPVAKSLPDVNHTLIQGSNDFISKAFFQNVDLTIPNLGHLGYLEKQPVFELVNQTLKPKLAELL